MWGEEGGDMSMADVRGHFEIPTWEISSFLYRLGENPQIL